jgi:hypothetical protein
VSDTTHLVRALDAADRLEVDPRILYRLVDDGVLTAHCRDDRLWVDLGRARRALADQVPPDP